MLIAPTKYRNPNNRIRLLLATTFTAEMHFESLKIPTEKSLARVLLLYAKNEKCSAVKFYFQFHMFIDSSLAAECKNWKIVSSTITQLHLNLCLISIYF